jgi:pre-mRNA-splicing helicase BRR2
MLSILNEMGKRYDPETQTFDFQSFKIAYNSAEKMVGNFTNGLKHYEMKVGELTGDAQMTKQQMAEASVFVTTPEKWDVVARKHPAQTSSDIADEIHLLHDDREPAVEAVVARTIGTDSGTSDRSVCLQRCRISKTLRPSHARSLRKVFSTSTPHIDRATTVYWYYQKEGN